MTHNPEDYVAKFKCMSRRCGHVQLVKPYRVHEKIVDGEKKLMASFGSAADHCDVCDGPVEHLGRD